MSQQKEYDFKDYEGKTPKDVLVIYAMGLQRKRIPDIDKKCLFVFLKMVNGEETETIDEMNLIRRLYKPHFQRNFVLTAGSLMLVLKHIEAYEVLNRIQNIIDSLIDSSTLINFRFWDSLLLKPKGYKG